MHPLCGPTTSNPNNKLRMHRYTKAHRVMGSWCAGMIGHDQSASALAQLHNLILEYHMGPILPSRTLHRCHVCIGLMHPHHDAYKYAGSPVWPWTSRHRSSTFPESIRSNGTKGECICQISLLRFFVLGTTWETVAAPPVLSFAVQFMGPLHWASLSCRLITIAEVDPYIPGKLAELYLFFSVPLASAMRSVHSWFVNMRTRNNL
jgi:hypothetical protein